VAEPALAAGIGEDSGSKKDLHALGLKKLAAESLEHCPFFHLFLIEQSSKIDWNGWERECMNRCLKVSEH